MARVGLVLGAGGVVGHAFHAGVLSALAEATKWDPRSAEIIVGTSAGSRVGAMLRAGVSACDLAAFATGDPPSEDGARFLARLGPPAKLPPFTLAGLFADFPAASSPRFLLRAALRPWEARFGTVLAASLPAGRVSTEEMVAGLRRALGDAWPEWPLWICAVRLDDGSRVVFGKGGAPVAAVATAVAASSAIPGFFTPVEHDGVRYVDGGVHSPTNLDLVEGLGLDLVLVSSPMSTIGGTLRLSADFPGRLLSRLRLAQEARQVRARGPAVVAFQPDAADQLVMGSNAMDPSRRRPVVHQARESLLRRLERKDFRERLAALQL
ncbi:MAG TPA: patatin-like phospholipase family protein [Candidatus Binatia bacterium]|nr:patatin-like phospholipase family protein [Candidatus Binatia bacterium]